MLAATWVNLGILLARHKKDKYCVILLMLT
jgi:hypothetical protein